MNPVPYPGHEYFIKIYLINFAYLYAKTWWTIQRSEIFVSSLFFNSLDLGFESKSFF